MGLSSNHQLFIKQEDTFTIPGNGTLVNVSTHPLSDFTMTVNATGIISAWTVILEGSIDGVNFTTISTHTNILGKGVAIYPGVNKTPVLYFRTRCSVLTLGLGTSITAIVLGSE